MFGCNKKKSICSAAKKRFGPIELTVIEIKKKMSMLYGPNVKSYKISLPRVVGGGPRQRFF